MRIIDTHEGEAYIWDKNPKNLENYCGCKSLSDLRHLGSVVNSLESGLATLYHFLEENECPDLRKHYEKEEHTADLIWEKYESDISFFENLGRIEEEDGYIYCTSCDLPVADMRFFE